MGVRAVSVGTVRLYLPVLRRCIIWDMRVSADKSPGNEKNENKKGRGGGLYKNNQRSTMLVGWRSGEETRQS